MCFLKVRNMFYGDGMSESPGRFQITAKTLPERERLMPLHCPGEAPFLTHPGVARMGKRLGPTTRCWEAAWADPPCLLSSAPCACAPAGYLGAEVSLVKRS